MSQLQLEIKQLIIDALGLEDLGPDDIAADQPLFGEGLGLDSVDVVQLIDRLNQRLPWCRLAPTAVFAHPTPAALAASSSRVARTTYQPHRRYAVLLAAAGARRLRVRPVCVRGALWRRVPAAALLLRPLPTLLGLSWPDVGHMCPMPMPIV